MDAFGVLKEVLDDYENFVKGFLEIKDDQIRSKVEEEIGDGLLWPEPWLALNPAFESGGTVSELVDNGVLDPEATKIFRDPTGNEIAFHRHQTDAFDVANRHESYVLTTGTGSGKSMSYIVPIVDRVLREGSGKGVRAIIVYPMNALANSQLKELEKFLGKTNPKVSLSSASMKYFIIKQIACPTPEQFNTAAPWRRHEHIETWLKPYILELAYTSSRLHRYA